MIFATRQKHLKLLEEFNAQEMGRWRHLKECVSETDAVFLCADLGITPETREYPPAVVQSDHLCVGSLSVRELPSPMGRMTRHNTFL